MADEILLTAEQEELLLKLVDKDKELRASRRNRIIASRGDRVLIGGEEIKIDGSAWIELCNQGLVTVTGHDLGIPYGAISPRGIAYSQRIRLARGLGPSIVVNKMLWIKDNTKLRYPNAVGLLEEAASLFWGDTRDDNLTTIGHKCREALQDFSSALHEQICPHKERLPIERTRDKLSEVIDTMKPKIGKTNHALADGLFTFWYAVDYLAQGVEHARPPQSADAERLLLYSHLVMAELDQLVNAP